jgi:hypothetical protein
MRSGAERARHAPAASSATSAPAVKSRTRLRGARSLEVKPWFIAILAIAVCVTEA